MTTTTYDQKPILAGKLNAAGDYNDNVTAANRTAAALKATADEVATEAVRKVNGVTPDADGSVTLVTGGSADALTQVQIDALPGSGLTPGRLLLNTDTDSLEVVGSDGIARADTHLLFGDGSDGIVTLSASTTLTRDMYYRSLTVPSGVTLTSGGYRIYASELLTVNGTIRSSPDANVPAVAATAGAAVGGSGGTGGAGGSVSTSSVSPGPPTAGATRATGSTIRALLALLSGGAIAGGQGGRGGLGNYYFPEDGSGVRLDSALGGAGGGALIIFARRIEGSGTISAAGNPGAAGAPGSGSTTQYGRADQAANGGGGGGGGGAIVLVTQRGRRGTVTVTAAGGAGGPGGAPGPQGGAGSAGAPGAAGSITEYTLAS